MNKLELLKLIANAPKTLKGYSELLDYARNAYKQMMGVFPEGIDNIAVKQAAKETAENRSKIIKFPEGGKDKTDPFKARPRKGELSVTIDGETKNMTPEGIMEFLMKRGTKGTDITGDTFIGKTPRTGTKRSGKIDYDKVSETLGGVSLRGDETFDELLEIEKNLKKNKEGVFGVEDYDTTNMSDIQEEIIKTEQRIGNLDPDSPNFMERMGPLRDKLTELKNKLKNDKADGGRIGFKNAGLAGDPMEGDQYVMSDIPGSPRIPMGQIGPVNVGIFGGGGFSKNQIVPGVDRATTSQNYGIMGQIPIGDTGFSIGGDYMKSRVNERFTGNLIPGQVFKNVPTDSDRFNIGINFKKSLSGGRFGFKDGSKPKSPGRRTFMKTIAGLASLPFVGKLFKPAAKVAETGGPAIAEGVKLGFDKFMMLVDKIKRLGRKTDRVTQTEREEGFIYTGKDGSQYELVEDLATGDVRITKDKPGVAVYNRGGDDVEGIDVIDDRSTFYLKRNRADETTKGKKPRDEYDEVRELPDEDGTFTDIDEVSDNTVNEVLEELGETRIKKASGGLAYMLGE
jgi:hypothetical protein